MKVVKIVLGIVIAITLVFFGTGLVVKEVVYTSEIKVNKPIKDVFIEFDTPESFKQWMSEIKSVETINQNPQKIGSEYKLIVERQGQEAKVKQKILAYVKNEKITLRYLTDGMIKIDDYIFSTDNKGGTKIKQHSSIRSNSFMLACTFPWFKSKFIAMSQAYLDKFKEVVENK